jgi:hypothetical protein
MKPSAAPMAAPTPSPASPAPASAPERSEIKGSGKPKAPAPSRQPSQDEIARRAFEIYASRGYAPGDQNADWLEAERQLKAGL